MSRDEADTQTWTLPETPAEAIFLKKKLIVIPMKNQYEQAFNAKALEELGVPVLKTLKKKHINKIKD